MENRAKALTNEEVLTSKYLGDRVREGGRDKEKRTMASTAPASCTAAAAELRAVMRMQHVFALLVCLPSVSLPGVDDTGMASVTRKCRVFPQVLHVHTT